jgi:co-chaperonin GroES (HSP10)
MIDLYKPAAPLAPMDFHPLEDWHHVVLSEPPQQSEGGIWLPPSATENWTHGTVRASGPGMRVEQCQLMNQADEDFDVLFLRESFRALYKGAREGTVRDRHLVAMLGMDDDLEPVIFPCNDWVLLSLAQCETEHSRVAIPEEFQRRPLRGFVFSWGPGRIIERGKYLGNRQEVCRIIGVDPELLLRGSEVYWDASADCLEVYRDEVECLLVRAGDLICIS